MIHHKPTRAQRREFKAMERRLRELDRADAQAKAAGVDPYEAWLDQRSTDPRRLSTASAAVPRHRSHRWRNILTVLLACAITTGAVMASRSPRDSSVTPDRPTPSVDASNSPLGEPLAPPPGPDTFRFIVGQSGQTDVGADADPVTWDPCRPIHYATNGIAPAEGQELLASSFEELHRITGFSLINDGPTSEPPGNDRRPFQPGRYGDRWAPLLVAWTTSDTIPELGGDTIGQGGGLTVGFSGSRRTYVSGVLFLDRPQIESQLSDAALDGSLVQRRSIIRAIMLHEIGHVFGLAHVSDPSQVMYPEVRPGISDYGTGDLRGLYKLATGPCSPEL